MAGDERESAKSVPKRDAAKPPAAKKPADSPSQLLSALAGGAVKFTPEPGDPQISAAFLLGWRTGEALHWAAGGKRVPWPDDDLALGEEQPRWRVLTGQINRAAVDLLGADAPQVGAASPQRAATKMQEFHAAALADLYIQEQFRGIAFALGCRLEQLCIGPTAAKESPGTAIADFQRAIPELKKVLLGLATKLPPNAAHGLINSLTLWAEQLERCTAKDHAAAADALWRQAGPWRAILAGEVAARDLLHLSDYVGTAEQVVARLHEFALKALRRHLVIPALLVVVLVAGGLILLRNDHVAAGTTGLIAALGLSWKGIGQYLGKAAARGEQTLWNGQLDWTIAYRTTISFRSPSKAERAGAEAKRMVRGGEAHRRRRETHYYVWLKWLRNWPDFEMDR